MTATTIPFNINDCVRVRLTPHGHKIVREQFRKLNAMLPITADVKFTPPRDDADGWSRWQMWRLMQTFGEHIKLAGPVPFETSIEFELDEQP